MEDFALLASLFLFFFFSAHQQESCFFCVFSFSSPLMSMKKIKCLLIEGGFRGGFGEEEVMPGCT
jgi:hypothetical protein